MGGATYFVTFIDNASKRIWAYNVKHKDEVLDIFKYFNTKVKRETGQPLKCIHTDNGGEYRGYLKNIIVIMVFDLRRRNPILLNIMMWWRG